MMRPTVLVLPVLVAALRPALQSAAGAGPEGVWETHADRTGARRSLVRIPIRDGPLAGVIERSFLRTGEEPEPLCRRCGGSVQNRRLLGMVILRGQSRNGARAGGSLLDPESGRKYRSAMTLEGRGRLRVRGYWGLFYRTQPWQRSRDGDETLPGIGETEAQP